MSEQNHTEEIERYLLDQMDESERIAFDQRLQTDPDLREELDLQQRITQQIRQVGRDDLRKRLKSIHLAMEEEPVEPGKDRTVENEGKVIQLRPQFGFWKYAMAASVVVALGLGIYLFKYSDQGAVNQPKLAFIQYAPTGADRQFGIADPDADTTFPTLIYEAVKPNDRAYRFDDTLRLYGQFDPSQLRLVYKPDQKTFTLEVGEQRYPLQRYKDVQPLNKAQK